MLPTIQIITFAIDTTGLSEHELESLTGAKAYELYKSGYRPSHADITKSSQSEKYSFLNEFMFEEEQAETVLKQSRIRIHHQLQRMQQTGKTKVLQGTYIPPCRYQHLINIQNLCSDNINGNNEHYIITAANAFAKKEIEGTEFYGEPLPENNPNSDLIYRATGYLHGRPVHLNAPTTFLNIRDTERKIEPNLDLRTLICVDHVDPAIQNAGRRNAAMGFNIHLPPTSRPPTPK